MEFINELCDVLSSMLWGPFTLILIIGIGLYLTITTGFFQIFHFKDVLKNTIGSVIKPKDHKNKGISPFQAVSTALAGSLGTGNIVGVAAAIAVGGPGAIFWMWVSAFFGMITKYAEVLLSVKYRVSNKEGFYGGPMYVMEKGLHCKPMGKIFSVFCMLASFGIGSTVQSNSASIALNKSFGIPNILTGIVITVLCVVIMIGGVKRLGAAAERIVPFMATMYILLALLVLFKNVQNIPSAFSLIIGDAFNFKSVASGGAGYTISLAVRYGIARSIFSSEAGIGSSPIAHAASNATSPVKQGQWGIFEVFFNTIVMCTMTALVIITTGAFSAGKNSGEMTLYAFSSTIGSFSQTIISICMVLFAFTTIVSWAYYGEQSVKYAIGEKFILPYRIVYALSTGIGSICAMSIVWKFADVFNVMMAIPNLISLILLSPQVISLTKEYKRKRFLKNKSN